VDFALVKATAGTPAAAAAAAEKLIGSGAFALVGGLDARTRTAVGDVANRRQTLFLTVGDPVPGERVRPYVFQVRSGLAWRKGALAKQPAATSVVDWSPELERFGAEQLNQRFAARFQQPMDATSWAAWAAVKALSELALRNPKPDRARLPELLVALRFDGHKGAPLGFGVDDHVLQQPIYLVGTKSGGRVGVVAEVSPEKDGSR
jgi:ABC-type branched-subunit amino acid transport system substrate-binding protein